MADTVITPSSSDMNSGAAGWAVAVIILLAVVLFGLFVWPGVMRGGNASTPGAIDVNVQMPQGQQGQPQGQQQQPQQGSGNTNTQPGGNTQQVPAQ